MLVPFILLHLHSLLKESKLFIFGDQPPSVWGRCCRKQHLKTSVCPPSVANLSCSMASAPFRDLRILYFQMHSPGFSSMLPRGCSLEFQPSASDREALPLPAMPAFSLTPGREKAMAQGRNLGGGKLCGVLIFCVSSCSSAGVWSYGDHGDSA